MDNRRETHDQYHQQDSSDIEYEFVLRVSSLVHNMVIACPQTQTQEFGEKKLKRNQTFRRAR